MTVSSERRRRAPPVILHAALETALDAAPALRAAPALGLALALLAVSPARAYEGSSIERNDVDREEQSEQEAPKQPVLTKAPEVITFVEAEYPPEALEAGESAEVGLLIDISAEGDVVRAEVIRSAGEAFDEAARAAVLQFELSPAELDGEPAAIRLEYVYHFEPRPPPPPLDAEPEVEATPTVTLEGRVLQRGTREPLVGASVYLPGPDLVTQTGPEGRFVLEGVPSGELRVEITELAHEKYVTTLEALEGEVTELTAYLWKKVDGFEATVRTDREKTEVARRTLHKEELRSVPGTFGDPVRVIQNLPGMARGAYVGGALLVRGSQPEDTGVLFDGVPIPLLYHFAGGPSVIAPSFIDRIDFYPGAYGARYGRAIAGIVDVETAPSTPRRFRGEVDVDILDAGFFAEGPVGEDNRYGSWAFAARRSYVDAFLPLLLEAFRQPGQATIVASPAYWDYQGRYDITLGKHALELTVFGSNDTLRVAQLGEGNTQPFSLNTLQGFHRARLKWSLNLGDGWRVFVAPSAGTTLQGLDLGDDLGLETNSLDLSLRAALTKDVGEWLTLELGLDFVDSDTENVFTIQRAPPPGETEPPEPDVIESRTRGASYATYVEAIVRPLPSLKLIPGFRLEMYDLPSGWVASAEPRVAARYAVTEDVAVKAAWGVFRQAPEPNDLSEDFGNPDLGLLKSQQTVAGVEWQLDPRLSLDVQGFYNWRSGLLSSSNELVERDGETVPVRYRNDGRGQAYGLEVLLKHDVTERMFGWIAYTLSRSEQYDADAGLFAPVSFDQTHILTLVGAYRLDGGWELSGRFRLTTGRPETPILGSVLDADSGRYRPIEGEPGSARGVTFHQLDLRAEKRWTFEQWRLSAYLDIQNVYNAENPEARLWDYRYRENAPLRGLPFLPTLGVRAEY